MCSSSYLPDTKKCSHSVLHFYPLFVYTKGLQWCCHLYSVFKIWIKFDLKEEKKKVVTLWHVIISSMIIIRLKDRAVETGWVFKINVVSSNRLVTYEGRLWTQEELLLLQIYSVMLLMVSFYKEKSQITTMKNINFWVNPHFDFHHQPTTM